MHFAPSALSPFTRNSMMDFLQSTNEASAEFGEMGSEGVGEIARAHAGSDQSPNYFHAP